MIMVIIIKKNISGHSSRVADLSIDIALLTAESLSECLTLWLEHNLVNIVKMFGVIE